LTLRREGSFASGLAAGAVIGFALAAIVSAGIAWFDDDEADPAADARQVIEANYFQPVDPSRLDDASVQGMLRDLKRHYDDRFSHYFTPEQLRDFEAATSGSFSGVGLTVSEVPRGLRVASVIPDTPAKRAGIEVGDLIVSVDGRSIAGVPAEVSTARIQGPRGTEVELGVVSPPRDRARDVKLERATVKVPAVRGRLRRAGGRKVAYVRLQTFSDGVHGELRDTLERLYQRGAEGLVLDLRGNGGGLLNEAVLTSSVFVDKGTIVTTEGRTQAERDYQAVGDALDPRPTVVLTNRDTASAAEILTAALSDYDLATVVGTRTFGKGTFQEVIHLRSGGALDLTVGEYLTADGVSLADKGIKPDVRATDARRTKRDEAVQAGLQVLAREL
jgi:carboxyl-terminal processing protease